ncbi:MAG: DUF302 domain-containing protein [Melioribacteraceae bacterium]|nr:DUF302 domain-containing protein [Melioribacteraceae bacterium]MCF8355129.1 DUF302 domain-containing protein [Melioribacteraceae bacterium]MCF8392394.1 DUF302 domain-containing protein [Melioribacteraceae bacterium]MCF8417915.1 DUF302 domain-containing protein [Melioribacteraceae bacterium]
MSYYFSKTVDYSYDQAIERATEELKNVGFGILTEIDVKATLKKKLDVDFRNYKILGACNPQFAHKALTAEDKIGVLLPCNVIVQEIEEGKVEIAVMNPAEAMSVVKNESLEPIAGEVNKLLETALEKM